MALQITSVPCALKATDIDRPRGSTPRVQALVQDVLERYPGVFFEQARLYGEAQPPSEPFKTLMMCNAYAFSQAHPKMTPVIHDNELIVGARLRATEGAFPGWHPDGNSQVVLNFANNTPPNRPDLREMSLRSLISPQGSFNHKVVDFAGYVRTGSAAIAKHARELAATRQGADREFAEAYALGHEAICAYIQSYADAANRMAGELRPDSIRGMELREIARICTKLAIGPAETFREALQAFWFAHMVAGDGPGRMDMYLWDFYQADLAAGHITPPQALELVECLMTKFHGDVFEGDYNVSSVFTLTLGGLLPDGSDGTNDLTRIFLQAARNVRLLRPSIYLRVHDNTPQDVLDLAMEMLGEGLAEPIFFGDKPVIEGLSRLGVPVEVARDYALSGCAEVCSPGLGNWGCPNGWINVALLVDEALRSAAAQNANTPEALWDAISKHIETVTDACQTCNTYVDEIIEDPRFHTTIFMPTCLEKGMDVVHGGAATYYGHWEGIGLSNAADMMYSALKLCCVEGASLSELYSQLDTADPNLLGRLHSFPKFGNADEQVDSIGGRIVDMLADALESRGTPLRKALVLGHLAGGENMHIGAGRLMGATLDGRLAGQPIADSLAGSQGQTISGPTAVVRSLCALDHSKLVAGNTSTLRLSPMDFRTPEDRLKVTAVIRTFVALGGSQLQINVADPQVLRDALENPAAHRGLMVRVAGYSADFTHIGRDLQEEIIARTEGLSV